MKGAMASIAPHILEAMRLMKAGDLAAATAVLRGSAGSAPPREPVPEVDPGTTQADAPSGASFMAQSFAGPEGSRPYRLFIPTRTGIEPRPLVVMLHGCTQDPEDFARGTRMNTLAEAHGCYVVYPGQVATANASRCWNWFRAGDQERERGEPAILAGIVREVVAAHAIDERRIYVAGMSAGGAMAVILGATHPELFAAVGVHSGLPYGAAHDLPSALAAMRAGARGRPSDLPPPPTIVFHGDADTTVDACNGHHVAAASAARPGAEPTTERAEHGDAGGRRFTRTTFKASHGGVVAEHWRVHGAGHQWSGGDASGSHTDARGPEASREMLRFFLERERPGG
jgi:poly(hydroxyalkanoate) depolymerase family esterase